MPGDSQLFLFDLDGTIYLGNELIDGARELLSLLKKQGKSYCFLTNNSSKSPGAYLDKLSGFGITVNPENLVTSTDVLIYYLNRAMPRASLYPVGTKALEEELRKAGFNLVHEYRDDPLVDSVVVGFDTTLHYQKLFEATRYIRKGVPYIATHPDLNCPLEEGVQMPDCGAIIAFIEASTGIAPAEIAGKPNPLVIDYLVETRGLKRNRAAIVGDRLYTDIQLGKNGKIRSILVLSGETTKEDLHGAAIKPDYIFAGVKELYRALK